MGTESFRSQFGFLLKPKKVLPKEFWLQAKRVHSNFHFYCKESYSLESYFILKLIIHLIYIICAFTLLCELVELKRGSTILSEVILEICMQFILLEYLGCATGN